MANPSERLEGSARGEQAKDAKSSLFADAQREWERQYEEAMQWRDWQTCDYLMEERAEAEWYLRQFVTPLWFRQSWRNTVWFLTHRWPWDPFWWATLIGLCPYCKRWDCID